QPRPGRPARQARGEEPMTTLEDRLAAALRAKAETVDVSPPAWEQLPLTGASARTSRRPRRPRRLVVATGALSAAASITVAVGTAAVIQPGWLGGHHTRPTPTPT